MRTKITILSAVALAAGLLSSHAQVYSANVVGYVNISVTNQFTLVENPLDASANGGNTVSNVLSTVPPGSGILKFNGSSFVPNDLDLFGAGWSDPNDVVAPGTGFFVRNGEPGTPFTITFVGTVKQGSTTNTLASGYTLAGSQTPVSAFIGDLGFAGNPGDYVYKFVNGAFVLYQNDLFGGGWSSTATDVDNIKGPRLNVGDSFFYNNQSGGTVLWTNNFTVQP